MEKKIELDSNRILMYTTRKEYPFNIQIHEGILDNDNNILKDYIFLMRDDYCFGGYTSSNNVNKIDFEFEDNHPLYLPLLNLLNNKQELIIDDDDTLSNNTKYMRIYNDGIIKVEFVNNSLKKYGQFDYDKFNIFVKNIQYDLRSKIDTKGESTKYLLFKFFKEVNESIVNYENDKKLIK